MMNRKKTQLLILSLSLLGGILRAGEETKDTRPDTPPPAAETLLAEDGKPIRDPVAQLRGKLLYKRSQAKKLERNATQNDPALGEKISRLEAEIEALFSAANPKLAEIYAEQKQLNLQIENLTRKE